MREQSRGENAGVDVAPISGTSDVSASTRPGLIRQVIRFGAVGAVNTAVDLVVLNLLIFTTGMGRSGAMFALYKGIAFFCAVLNSYLINRTWTFKRVKTKSTMLEGSQFLFISLLGGLVNIASAWYVATYTHPVWGVNPKLWPSVAALVGTLFALGFNFIGYKFWVFRHRQS